MNKTKLENETLKILVAITSSPTSKYLIKRAYEISTIENAICKAVHIDTGRILTSDEEKLLNENIKTARELGIDVDFIFDSNIVNGILRVAQKENINKIIIGKSLGRSINKTFFSDISQKLIKRSTNIDVYTISHPKNINISLTKFRITTFFNLIFKQKKKIFKSFSILFLVTIINLFLSQKIGYWSVGLIFLATITIMASFSEKIVILLNATAAALIWNFFFIPPRFTFLFDKIEDFIMDIIFFLVAIIIGNFNVKLHNSKELLRKKEKKLEDLYNTAKIINEEKDLQNIFDKMKTYLNKSFESETEFIKLSSITKNNITKNDKKLFLDYFEYKNKIKNYQNIIPNSEVHFIPMLYKNNAKGILKIKFKNLKFLTSDTLETLQNIANQIAVAIENNRLLEIQKEIEIANESEKIYKTVLDSISHELRTPITSITTAASGLFDDNIMKNPNSRIILINDIIEAAERLNRIIGNLLETIKFESGRLKINIEGNYISELIGSVSSKFKKICKSHSFFIDIEKDLPIIKFDFVLMEQVIFNLLYNAFLYTPDGSKINLKVYKENEKIKIIVEDNGLGIDIKDLDKIFNKFYRGQNTQSGGSGLGLSICKSIIDLHKGNIYCENSVEKGAKFIIEFPIE